MTTPLILIHGGAGTLSPDRLSAKQRQAILAGLRRAVEAGRTCLKAGASALDAVTAAVSSLEDEPNFNAGRGSVFTSRVTTEMGVAIIEGHTARIGAVAAIRFRAPRHRPRGPDGQAGARAPPLA